MRRRGQGHGWARGRAMGHGPRDGFARAHLGLHGYAWVCLCTSILKHPQASPCKPTQTHAYPHVHRGWALARGQWGWAWAMGVGLGQGPWEEGLGQGPWVWAWARGLGGGPGMGWLGGGGGASILGPFEYIRGGWRAKCQYDNIGPTGYCSATLGPILQHLKCIVGRLVVPGPVGDPGWEL